MKYCYETTINHIIPRTYKQCLEEINELILREGYDGKMPLFSAGQIIINLDVAEELIAKEKGIIERNKSMDFGFGLKDQNLSSMIAFGELRLNYKNPNNMKRDSLMGKVGGSIMAMTDQTPIYEKFIFIFNTDKVYEAFNRLYRMNPRIPTNFIVMDLNKLKEAYFS